MINYIKVLKAFALLSCLIATHNGFASLDDNKLEVLRAQCERDLDFMYNTLIDNSAPKANTNDKKFTQWLNKGYELSKELSNSIRDADDCYFVLNYFANGFNDQNIRVRSSIKLPKEFYPGILSVLQGEKHVIIYKNTALQYLKEVNIGDEITHLNDIPIDRYYKEYLLPFYAGNSSQIDKIKASTYALIVDGNSFLPTPRSIKIQQAQGALTIDLLFTKLSDESREAWNKIKNPSNNKFRVDLFSGGAWIRIPSFFPSREEEVFFKGMLTSLKDFAKEDYIVFDLRGNRGGSTKWERPILRNLWGDNYIKSLGLNHDYNSLWQKRLRISKENFKFFKQFYGKYEIKDYAQKLTKGEMFYNIKWNIFDQLDNLFNNLNNDPVRAKIYILTDNFCTGTCWLFTREMLQMPNVKHIGGVTGVLSNYSDARTAKLPSENFELLFPIQHHIFPAVVENSILTPSVIFKGDFKNDLAVVDWVVEIIEKDLIK